MPLNPNVHDVVEGQVIQVGEEEHTVLADCNDKNNGHWWCVTHDRGFINNITLSGHVNDKDDHVITWVCHEHGPEIP